MVETDVTPLGGVPLPTMPGEPMRVQPSRARKVPAGV